MGVNTTGVVILVVVIVLMVKGKIVDELTTCLL